MIHTETTLEFLKTELQAYMALRDLDACRILESIIRRMERDNEIAKTTKGLWEAVNYGG